MSETSDPDKMLEELKAARAERKEAARRAQVVQEVADLTALEELEAEHGVHALVQTPVEKQVPGLPMLVVSRVPRPPEIKRFRATVKAEDGEMHKARAELSDICLLYPEREVYDKLCTVYPSLKAVIADGLVVAAAGRMTRDAKF